MKTRLCDICGGAEVPTGPFVFSLSLDDETWTDKYSCPRCGCLPYFNTKASLREMWDRFERRNAAKLTERPDLCVMVGAMQAITGGTDA